MILHLFYTLKRVTAGQMGGTMTKRKRAKLSVINEIFVGEIVFVVSIVSYLQFTKIPIVLTQW